MPYPVTSLSAALLGLWLIILSARVIAGRGSAKVSLGDGDNNMLIRRIRAQGNFAEYVPTGLILLFLAETQTNQVWLVAVPAILLVAGRLAHGIALSFTDHWGAGRAGGMMMTLTAIGLLALLNLWQLIATL